VLDEDGYVLQETGFDRLDIPVKDSEKLFGEQKTTDEMTRRELGDHVRLFQKSGIDVQRFVVDYHLKLALPLAAVIWVLVAAPMAVASARGGRFYGVVVSIVVAFGYYVAVGIFRSLGGNGAISPVLANRLKKNRSCDTKISVPSYSCSAASTASWLGISR
jgi:lipopolysaccharide export LptBFGC system permease protein LptF